MRYFVTIDDAELCVEISEHAGGGYEVRLLEDADADAASASKLDAEVSARGADDVTVRVGSRVFDLTLDGKVPDLIVSGSGHRATLKVETARMRAAASVRRAGAEATDGVITSPMPGKVVKLLVAEGDEVEAGAPIVVVEAMKMENELSAPKAGTVQKLHVAQGDTVEGGARLVTVA